MNSTDYVELEKRAEEHGIGDDPSLAQLLHIIQFKEVVKNGHKRTMRELATWEKTIASCVEQRIEEASAADLIDPPVKGTAEGTCRTCAKYDGSVCILDDFAPGSLDNTCAYDSYEARAVTDAERREVVERLRAPMESMLADSAGEPIRLRRVTGCRRGQDIYERLADLIEGKN